nr:DUF3540 domain-containing protein [uncultured Pseudomonas sp.]
MSHEAPHTLERAAVLRHARINAVEGERFGVVSADGCRYWLKPALGCLLQPAVGDRVLVSLEGNEGYILSVLERSQAQTGQLRIEGDLNLTLPSGALTIQTRDGMLVDAGALLALTAHTASLRIDDAQLALGTLQVAGQRADNHWLERNDTTARHCEQTLRHEADYGDSSRRVQGHEDLQSGSLRQRVDKDWSLHGETLDLFADASVAVGGERIKLG